MKRPRRATVRGLFGKTAPKDTKYPGDLSAALYGPPDVPDVPQSVRKRAAEYYAARRVERAVDAEVERRRAGK